MLFIRVFAAFQGEVPRKYLHETRIPKRPAINPSGNQVAVIVFKTAVKPTCSRGTAEHHADSILYPADCLVLPVGRSLGASSGSR
jgi:hypothetical protein